MAIRLLHPQVDDVLSGPFKKPCYMITLTGYRLERDDAGYEEETVADVYHVLADEQQDLINYASVFLVSAAQSQELYQAQHSHIHLYHIMSPLFRVESMEDHRAELKGAKPYLDYLGKKAERDAADVALRAKWAKEKADREAAALSDNEMQEREELARLLAKYGA